VIRRVIASLAVLASMRCARPAFEHLDECPNPIKENMSWRLVEGNVVEVTGAPTFRLQTAQGVLTVTLPNVGEPYDAGARAMLQRMIDGKRVSVMLNPSAEVRNDITGEVHDAKERDVSRQLLRSGAASFVDAPAYTLSDYSECLNRIAEREAKADHLGIWH
jgi:endonuclease YncB( thermonuclease family)